MPITIKKNIPILTRSLSINKIPSFETMWNDVKTDSIIHSDMENICDALELKGKECEDVYKNDEMPQRYDWGVDNSLYNIKNNEVFRCFQTDNPQSVISQLKKNGTVNGKGIRSSWTWDKDSAICYWGNGNHDIIFRGKITPDQIDVKDTIYASMINNSGGENEERETVLKSGSRIQLTGYKIDTNNWKDEVIKNVLI